MKIVFKITAAIGSANLPLSILIRFLSYECEIIIEFRDSLTLLPQLRKAFSHRLSRSTILGQWKVTAGKFRYMHVIVMSVKIDGSFLYQTASSSYWKVD